MVGLLYPVVFVRGWRIRVVFNSRFRSLDKARPGVKCSGVDCALAGCSRLHRCLSTRAPPSMVPVLLLESRVDRVGDQWNPALGRLRAVCSGLCSSHYLLLFSLCLCLCLASLYLGRVGTGLVVLFVAAVPLSVYGGWSPRSVLCRPKKCR